MAGLTSLPCVVLCLSTMMTRVGSTSEEAVTVKAGGEAVLPCRGPENAAVALLEWKKTGEDSEGFVFFFRENRSYKSYQIPSFKDRVALTDPEMKKGDMSVTLKNATASDSGEYECSLHIGGRQRRKRATDFRSIVKLQVVDADSGRRHWAVAAPLVALFAVAVLWKLKAHTEQPAADEAGEQQIV